MASPQDRSARSRSRSPLRGRPSWLFERAQFAVDTHRRAVANIDEAYEQRVQQVMYDAFRNCSHAEVRTLMSIVWAYSLEIRATYVPRGGVRRLSEAEPQPDPKAESMPDAD